MTSLEGWGSAIELRPHVRWKLCLGTGEHGQRTGSGHRRRTVAAGRGGPRHKGRLVHWPWLDSFGRRCRISAVTAAGGSCEALRRLGSRPMDDRLRIGSTGCGAAWLARLLWEQEAAGSNPAIPTNLRHCRSWHARAPIWRSTPRRPSCSRSATHGGLAITRHWTNEMGPARAERSRRGVPDRRHMAGRQADLPLRHPGPEATRSWREAPLRSAGRNWPADPGRLEPLPRREPSEPGSSLRSHVPDLHVGGRISRVPLTAPRD
jgi:hypothetical protein